MNIALFAAPGALAPLQGLWRWFTNTTLQHGPTHPSVDRRADEFAIHSIADSAHCPSAEWQIPLKTAARRPLRIVHILEAGQAPAQIGRIVISGCMADVCAELERLAAREAAPH
jgi:hypothetical protein